MTNFKHQGLVKALFCLNILLNVETINADPLDLEEQRENYRAKHNAMAVKYERTQYIIDPQRSHRDITLLQAAKELKNEAEKLKLKTKKDLDEIDTFGQLVISSGNVVTQSLLEGNVQEETTKCTFAQSIYRCVAFLGSFFNN